MASEATTGGARRAKEPSAGSRSLLDLVPELAESVPASEQPAVRRSSIVETVAVAPGHWEPAELSRTGGAVGFLIAEGVVVRDVLMAGSIASDLLGPGDVAGLGVDDAALIPADVRWTVSEPARVALLDPKLMVALAAWPAVTTRLLARATRQTSTLAVHRAISQLPRVEQRLLALFWHLAERWGRVGTDGIVVRLALTHETLGRMVGARRPTVSLALKELAIDGLVVRRDDGAWLLRRDGLERLDPQVGGTRWNPPDASVIADVEPPSSPARLQVVGSAEGDVPERRVPQALERQGAAGALGLE